MFAGSGKHSEFDEKGTSGEDVIAGLVTLNTLLRFFT